MGPLFAQLSFRLLAASGVLAVVISATFGLLVVAIADLRNTGRLADRSRTALTAADGLGELVLDLETGSRGFVITRDEQFLDPWKVAVAKFPQQARSLEGLADSPEQVSRVRRIVREGRSYIRDYSIPLVRAVPRHPAYAGSVVATAEGEQRVGAIRAGLDRFAAIERDLLASRQDRTDADAQRAIVLGIVGLVGSFALIASFAFYLLRSVGRPVQRAAGMAGRLADGDLTVRMPETGAGEIGDLERSFNVMASSLERNRDELIASRARIVAAADEARRRIRRDLHDGGQQRLVHALITLKLARRSLEDEGSNTEALIDEALEHTEGTVSALRDLSHGILPSVLARGGLRAGIESLVSRMSLPVSVDVSEERFPSGVEATAYFVVSEALTNAVKHSGATRAEIRAQASEGALRVEIRDDGKGGAMPDRGTGLVGLRDRVAALAGSLDIESPPGGGTRIVMTLPLSGS
jgi:signal transduction histidine kinase